MKLSDVGEVDMKKVDNSSKNFAKLLINGYESTEKNRKREKKLKRKIVCSLCVGVTGIVLMSGSIICSQVCCERSLDLLEQNGYKEANAKYRTELVLDLSEQYENGEIDVKEYDEKVSSIKNLDKEKYFEENTNEETYNKFKNLRTAETVSTAAVLPTVFIGGGGLGMAAGLESIENKRKKLKECGITLD